MVRVLYCWWCGRRERHGMHDVCWLEMKRWMMREEN